MPDMGSCVTKPVDLRLTFLGGVGEIGMNCMAIEGPEGIVVVDCGVMFPSNRFMGPDLILPDLEWFRAHRSELAGVIITHGHEDHIGAVPLALMGSSVPIFAPRFAGTLMREKALEYPGASSQKIRTISPGQTVTLAGMDFEFFRVTHSIPDALGFALRTSAGWIVHTGDFRIDQHPTMGEPMDIGRLKSLGDEGVLLALSDSTNVERPGRTVSESVVAEGIHEVVANHPGRVLVSMFSSNIERVANLARIAGKTRRKLGMMGRSLGMYTRVALESGFSPCDPNLLVDPGYADKLPGRETLILVAGSQGEPRAAMTRIANGDHPDLSVREGDLVIYSARIIPGNEREILRVFNQLERRGATVVHEGHARVHTSGHAYRDELADVLTWLRPRFFVPVHGEYRYLKAHARLAEDTVQARAVVADAGDVVRVTDRDVRVVDHLDFEPFFVEDTVVGTADDLKLKERRRLFFNGLAVVTVRLGKGKKGAVSLKPGVTLHGIPDPDNTLLFDIEEALTHLLRSDHAVLEREPLMDEIQICVRRIVRRQQERKPQVQTIFVT
jgi:ribonuclease J